MVERDRFLISLDINEMGYVLLILVGWAQRCNSLINIQWSRFNANKRNAHRNTLKLPPMPWSRFIKTEYHFKQLNPAMRKCAGSRSSHECSFLLFCSTCNSWIVLVSHASYDVERNDIASCERKSKPREKFNGEQWGIFPRSSDAKQGKFYYWGNVLQTRKLNTIWLIKVLNLRKEQYQRMMGVIWKTLRQDV